jgi:hypothetical protein
VRIAFVLPLLLLCQIYARADVVVTRLDATKPERGISLVADDKRVSVQTADGKIVEGPVEEVIEARFVPAPKFRAARAAPFEVRLLDGSRLRGNILETKPDFLRIRSLTLAPGNKWLLVPIEEIIEIRRVAGARIPGASKLVRIRDQDAAYRLDGSRVSGTVHAFAKKGVRMDRGDLGERLIPYSDLAALFIDNDIPAQADGVQAIARFADESAIVLPLGFRIARGELTGKTASGIVIRTKTDQLVSLGYRGGRFDHLSDIAPHRTERKPFFPLPELPAREVMLDFVCPVRRDRSPDNHPIRLQGRRYDKGIGVRPDTTLTWKLDGTYKRFRATCGIDDEVLGSQYGKGAGTGSVIFRVLLDGKEAWNSGIVNGGKAPKHIELKLGTAREISLQVSVVPGTLLPEGRTDSTELDNAVWARPLLIR